MELDIAKQKELSLLLSRAADGLDLQQEFLVRGRGHVVGITASAGAGKSTLCDKIIRVLRQDGSTVAVLAIDPSSPSSGGAYLGDRILMRQHYLDGGVFIRSLSSRGAKDSSAPNISALVNIASRFADVVLVESPGAGQADLGIQSAVDTLIFIPDVNLSANNLMKAGIHDYAHILAVNIRKEQFDTAKKFAGVLAGFCSEVNGWKQLVFELDASTGEGVEELVRDGICGHSKFISRQN